MPAYVNHLHKYIVIDIETVSNAPSFEDLDSKWQNLWQKKVEKIKPDDTSLSAFYEQRAGVMAEFSKIICVAIGYFKANNISHDFITKSIAHTNEVLLLQEVIDTLSKIFIPTKNRIFAGHNIKEFDIPFLCRRLLANNQKIPDYLNFQNKKPWETEMYDTFQLWRFGDYKNFTSLNLLAAVLNIPSPKTEMDGSMVHQTYWQNPEKGLPKIATYCEADIKTVANIILSFHQLPILKS